MLYRQLVDQQSTPPTILNSGTKSPLTKAYVQLAPFLEQTNTISWRFPVVGASDQPRLKFERVSFSHMFLSNKISFKSRQSPTVVYFTKRPFSGIMQIWQLSSFLDTVLNVQSTTSGIESFASLARTSQGAVWMSQKALLLIFSFLTHWQLTKNYLNLWCD